MRRTIKIAFALLLTITSYGQHNSSNGFSWDDVKFGGRVNLDISNTITSVILSPSAIYPLNSQVSMGASVSFGYTKFKTTDDQLFNYGLSILSYYSPISEIQLSVELEETFVKQKWNNLYPDEVYESSYNFLAFYLGAGYRVRNIIIGMRYDILYKEGKGLFTSPYSPFVQFSF